MTTLAAQRCPELFEYLEHVRLGVTAAAVLAPHLEPETAAELLAAAARRSRSEIVRMLEARSRPVLAPLVPAGDAVVETTSCQHAPVHTISLADLGAEPACDSPAAQHAAPHVESPRRGRVSPSADVPAPATGRGIPKALRRLVWERNEAHQARYDDIRSGLRSVGFTDAEAKRGAEMADAMPDAALETCLKMAMTAVTRAIALRGERRARCSA